MSEPVPYPVLNDDEPVRQLNELDASLTYSYANYLNWLFPERVELIKGKIFKMSPAPSSFHQLILGKIYRRLGNFLEKLPCRVFISPFDVRFPKESQNDEAIFTVLQPDICVVCNSSKIDARGCIGAPDLVVEVLSPSNTKTELLHKYRIYEEFGVKEYWVVSQGDKSILIYTLNEMGKFQPSKIFALSEKITSSILPGFELALDDVFEDINP
ncbi:Uma2 family endonuclease [Pedobacter suwonensis]|uniref:Uma2 family endonuclease n=1 Tax=Pedobacter suwonensis TaxID=332999 RepID=UPI0011A5EC7E|nr:Uma2 family endonuclease [Pedobacter suwonensis]